MKHIILSCLLLVAAGCGDDINTQGWFDAQAGKPGVRGEQGETGSPGLPGKNSLINLRRTATDVAVCAAGFGVFVDSGLDQNENGSLEGSEIKATSLICDGAPAATQVIEVINPCGDKPAIVDEVILRLSNNVLLSSFSDSANGNNTRLALLPPGSYVTTDGSSCYFTVDNNNQISNEHY